jgi:HD-GYP domain-containing protein (c-di-GMP phosphodiesterase class II)
VGKRVLRGISYLESAIPGVLHHHERYDGQGYPDQLSGPEIPLAGRILAVADAFDAMTSDRPYRRAMSSQAAIAELEREAGKQFDPEIVEAFIRSWQDDDLASLLAREENHID